jgi:hypothetical protein
MAGCYEQYNETSSHIKGGELFEQLSDYNLLKRTLPNALS